MPLLPSARVKLFKELRSHRLQGGAKKKKKKKNLNSIDCLQVIVQSLSCVQLCDPMDCSMLGLPVPHHHPKLAQIHAHCISDAIHPTISSSDTLFSFCPQSFPVSGTFPMSQLFTSGDQNTWPSALASVLPMSIQDWFPLRLTGLISLLSKGLSGVFSSTTVWRPQFFGVLPSS